MNRSIRISIDQKPTAYAVRIGSGILHDSGRWARRCLPKSCRKIAVISNERIFSLHGPRLTESVGDAGFEVSVFLLPDGERFKNLKSLAAVLGFLGEQKISRTDAVAAFGGGVIGDLAGFAASVHLRGVAYLQVPTSLLAMIDSSVGGKTGINSPNGKNLVGAFYQPAGVLIDVGVLNTLPARELTAGFCEAVKHGVIAGRKLFDRTAAYLLNRGEGFAGNAARFVAEQVSFKASIVTGDPLENVASAGARSRKILNYGHTFGHALEKLTNYRSFKHGEAVGHGIRFAAELSKNLELLEAGAVKSINDVVHRAGRIPPIRNIDPDEMVRAFSHDKKVVGDRLHWVLLKRIGRPKIISNDRIPHSILKKTVRDYLDRHDRS